MIEEDDDTIETIGAIYTHWPCSNCGSENETEGDASGETIACQDCGQKNRIEHV